MRYAAITERLAGLGSGKWAVHFAARELIEAGEAVIELTIGEPDVPTETALLDVCDNSMRGGRTRYSSGRGEPELLMALAEKYSRRSGRPITPENILCFPGTQTALFAVIMGLVQHGDDVLVGDPLYATYEGVIRASGAAMVPVPLDAASGFRMSPEALERAITQQSRCLLLNNPHNPSGAVLGADEIAAIGDVCRRHGLWIVCDEVYEHLIFETSFASPFDNPDLSERTIVVSSISKSHAAPGFRSGWAVGPAEFCQRLLPLSETMLFGNQPFIADMTAFALNNGSNAAEIMRTNFHRRAKLLAKALSHQPDLRCLMPQAGMFMLIDTSATGLDGERYATALLKEERVAVMPGSSFGNEARNFIRVSLTVPDEILLEAADRISRFAILKMAESTVS